MIYFGSLDEVNFTNFMSVLIPYKFCFFFCQSKYYLAIRLSKNCLCLAYKTHKFLNEASLNLCRWPISALLFGVKLFVSFNSFTSINFNVSKLVCRYHLSHCNLNTSKYSKVTDNHHSEVHICTFFSRNLLTWVH